MMNFCVNEYYYVDIYVYGSLVFKLSGKIHRANNIYNDNREND